LWLITLYKSHETAWDHAAQLAPERLAVYQILPEENFYTKPFMSLSVLYFQISDYFETPNVYILLDQLTSSVEKIAREANSSPANQDFHRC
jgi:hypothetical protein